MAIARTLLLLLGALGVLLLGAVSPTMAATEPAPCHTMASMTSHGPSAPSERPMKSMACCVACIAAPVVTPPVRTATASRRVTPRPIVRIMPTGRRPSPDTGPPKA